MHGPRAEGKRTTLERDKSPERRCVSQGWTLNLVIIVKSVSKSDVEKVRCWWLEGRHSWKKIIEDERQSQYRGMDAQRKGEPEKG